jgi:hypothetical protein
MVHKVLKDPDLDHPTKCSMEFEFDPGKSERNKTKQGIDNKPHLSGTVPKRGDWPL